MGYSNEPTSPRSVAVFAQPSCNPRQHPKPPITIESARSAQFHKRIRTLSAANIDRYTSQSTSRSRRPTGLRGTIASTLAPGAPAENPLQAIEVRVPSRSQLTPLQRIPCRPSRCACCHARAWHPCRKSPAGPRGACAATLTPGTPAGSLDRPPRCAYPHLPPLHKRWSDWGGVLTA